MPGLTTDALVQACQIFLQLAYPGGEKAIPPAKRCYLDIPTKCDLAGYHAENPLPAGSFAVIENSEGGVLGYAVRLGCEHFPHLKLKALAKAHRGEQIWVFAVDTHDAFADTGFRPPPEHPDYKAWTQLQEKNRNLKVQIEKAWEEAGLLTFNGLLRQDLADEEE